MSLNTNALIETAELKTYLAIEEDDDSVNEEFLEKLINEASQFIEDYCHRKFITVAAIYEIFDGTGTKEYYTRYKPIVTDIGSVQYWTGTAWATFTSTAIEQDSNRGRIYFTDGNVFTKMKDYWRISYQYGYTRANIPADLKGACIKLVALKKKQFEGDMLGVKSKSFGDQSITYNFDEIPKDVKTVLEHYRGYGD